MADIAGKVANIRQAILGKDVRESLAQGIEEINIEVESTTDRQTTLEINMTASELVRQENETDRQAAEITRETNETNRITEHTQAMTEVEAIKAQYEVATLENTAVELTEARGSFAKLKPRLDNIDAQLSDTMRNIKNFGAHSTTEVGYETFDSTNAIQAAIDSLIGKGGKVFFPVGDYQVSNTLTLYDDISLVGLLRGGVGSNISRVIRTADNPILNMNSLKNNVIESISLCDSTGSNFTTAAVIMTGCYMFNFNNVFLSNSKNILFNNRNFDSRLTNCFFGASSLEGAVEFADADSGSNGCNEINFVNCHWEHYSNTALKIGINNHDIRFIGCKFESTLTTTQKIINIKGSSITFDSACTINFNNSIDCCIYLDNALTFRADIVFTTTDNVSNILNPLVKCNGACSYFMRLTSSNINVARYVPDYVVYHENVTNNYITSDFYVQTNMDTQYFRSAGKNICNISANRVYMDIPISDLPNINNRSGITTYIEDNGNFIGGRITNPTAGEFYYCISFVKDGVTKDIFKANSLATIFEIPKFLKFTGKGSIGSDSAIPTTDYHSQGEILFNSAPVAGGVLGWSCVASGTPGTWKSFGQIST